MYRTPTSQRGIYLAVSSLIIVVLIGTGALAIDLGRLFLLRSQMQNAADSAALAAAGELSGRSGAQTRAEAAARSALDYQSRLPNESELLGTNLSFQFFCAISSANDPDDPTALANYCGGSTVVENGVTRWLATGDEDTHYVRVIMDQSQSSDAYSTRLIFLPVLQMFGLSPDQEVALQASAMAGRSYQYCYYAPLMMCNPFEDDGLTFDEALDRGDQLKLVDSNASTAWNPGQVGFLQLGGNGVNANAPFLGAPEETGCTEPVISPMRGDALNPMGRAANTRFDIYLPLNNPEYESSDYPPDINIMDYPEDLTFDPDPPERVGHGDWDRATYWTAFHEWQSWGGSLPQGYNEMTRFEMYKWENSQSKLPVRNPDIAYDSGGGNGGGGNGGGGNGGGGNGGGGNGGGGNTVCTNTSTGDTFPDWVCDSPPDSIPDNATGVEDRRVLSVAVIECVAQNISNRSREIQMFGNDGFASIFLTESSKTEIWGEYIRWNEPGDLEVRLNVQLYD